MANEKKNNDLSEPTIALEDSNRPTCEEPSIPSVSRLMIRKSLSKSKSCDTISISHEKGVELETNHNDKTSMEISDVITLEQNEDHKDKLIDHNKHKIIIKRAKRRLSTTSSQSKKLILWEKDTLLRGSDPIGKGLISLIEKGATSSLFLTISPPKPNSPVPHFISTAALNPGDRSSIWEGLCWDPMISPELWNYFTKAGFAELSPPGTATNLQSTRNLMRAAFGIMPDEWLLLIRTGPLNACRGILAVVSEKSLISDLVAVLPLLVSPLHRKNAA
ncbi:MAG: hypothetical protein AABZ06_03535 [Bdellovibrionota bacterium]